MSDPKWVSWSLTDNGPVIDHGSLTVGELQALRDDFITRVAAIKRAYETSTGIERDRQLLSALVMCGTTLPLWVYDALLDQQKARLQEHDNWLLTGEHVPPKGLQKPDRDGLRWLMVIEARRNGFKGDAAYDEAAKRLDGTLAEGTGRTMKSSYLNFRKKQKGQNQPP
jgi:hypothetical protein